jgi:hypothetical protein
MKFSRARVLALLLVAVFSVAAIGATSVASATDASAAKKKKCKKGYERVGKKCKRKPFVITPDSITLVAGVLKKGQFGATGYSYFPATNRASVLKGYWQISNGIGFEKLKVEWRIAKGQNFSNFTDTQRKVGLSGPNMTATLVIQGVRSNAFPLKQD